MTDKKTREIKFRAWDENRRVMIPNITLAGLKNWEGVNFYEWMQFTGLLDKNGKEIYQGDLLKFTNPEGERFYEGLAEVTSEPCGYCFRPIPQLSEEEGMIKGYDSSMFWHDKEYYEVIGNIYENPELLTPHEQN
jgi:uncharacterized phage protein (TIGR01671 family)